MLSHRQVRELVNPSSGVSLDEVALALKLGYEQDQKNTIRLINKLLAPHKKNEQEATRSRMVCALAIGMVLAENPSESPVLLPILRQLSRDPDPRVRSFAARAMKTINSRQYHKFHTIWVGWLAHSDKDTRKTVLEGLAFVPRSGKTRKQTREIFRVLSLGAGDPDESVARTAGRVARKLLFMGLEGVKEEILEWAGSSNPSKRTAALVAASGVTTKKMPDLSIAVTETIKSRRQISPREKRDIMALEQRLARAASA